MSGVIMNGVQWEHCNGCGDWVRIQALGYLKPSAHPQQPYGLDLCVDCAAALIECRLVAFNDIIPGDAWVTTEVEIEETEEEFQARCLEEEYEA